MKKGEGEGEGQEFDEVSIIYQNLNEDKIVPEVISI